MAKKARPHVWVVSYASEWLRGKDERRRVKEDLKRGLEPQPKYATGRIMYD